MAPGVAATIRSFLPDPVPVDIGSHVGTMGSYGLRGMNSGSTCGINTSISMVGDQALPNSVVTPARNTPITEVLRHFSLDPHPNNDVGNASWFLDHEDKLAKGGGLDDPVAGMVYGSLECHSVVAKHRSRGQFLGGITDPDLDQCRSEFCGRLVADMCYRMLSNLNAHYGGPRGTYDDGTTPAIVDVPSSCRTEGCHDTSILPGGFTPQTDCFACHQG